MEEVVRVSEVVLTGEVLCSCSGAPEVTVGVSEIVSLDETFCSCSGAWYHVGTFLPQSISVHNFWFSSWSQLDSVNQVIDLFGDDIGTLPRALHFWS